MNNSWKIRHRSALVAAGALGLAMAGSAAWAQVDPGKGAADPTNSGNTSAVIIHAPPSQPPSIGIPADKAAAFDAEAAKNQAWQNYRDGVPLVTTSTLDMLQGYPGLHSLGPDPADQPAVAP